MPRGNERHCNSPGKIHAIVPVVGFDSDCAIVISHDGVIAEWRDDAGSMCACQPRQSSKIEMIVVAVRHQHDIDRRQVCKDDTWIVDPFRPDKAERRRARRPHRVEQHIQTRGLNEPAGMADIGNAPVRAVDACRRTIGVRRWCPGRPLRLGAAPVTIDEPTQQIASASRLRAARVEEPRAIKMIGDRAFVIARHWGQSLPAWQPFFKMLVTEIVWNHFGGSGNISGRKLFVWACAASITRIQPGQLKDSYFARRVSDYSSQTYWRTAKRRA